MKELLIDAICGAGVPWNESDKWEKHGMAVFTGNQHNPQWAWDRKVLQTKPLEYLEELYAWCKK